MPIPTEKSFLPPDESAPSEGGPAELTGIDTTVAGQDLDALIAEKVMGYRWRGIQHFNTEQRVLVLSDEDAARFPLGVSVLATVPSFSTEINAAWEVLEKLRDEFGWELSDCRQPGLPYAASIYPICELSGKDRDEQQSVIDQGYVIAETLPLAICRAALKALGLNGLQSPEPSTRAEGNSLTEKS